VTATSRPSAHEIAEGPRTRIREGTLEVGAEPPTRAEPAAESGVERATVRQACAPCAKRAG